jgi:hypothetical protein
MCELTPVILRTDCGFTQLGKMNEVMLKHIGWK